jgi:hypothetical protein
MEVDLLVSARIGIYTNKLNFFFLAIRKPTGDWFAFSNGPFRFYHRLKLQCLVASRGS